MFRRRRLVRLHLEEPHPTMEGIWAGMAAGHYRLLRPQLLESEARTHSLDGEAWVPAGRVVFVQRLNG